MHIILLKFGDNKSDAPKFMEAHNAWVATGVADDVFQCVGSLDTGGGFILAHGEDNQGIRNRVNEDPFVQNDVVTVEIHQVDVKRTAPQLAYLVTES